MFSSITKSTPDLEVLGRWGEVQVEFSSSLQVKKTNGQRDKIATLRVGVIE